MEHLIPLLLAAFVVGMSKGGLAAAAALTVPALALMMNPVQAAAILLPVYIVTDWVGVWLYRRHWSGRNLAILVPGMLAGTVIATLVIPFTPEWALLAVTGGIGLWYVARRWTARAPDAQAGAAVGPGLFWGVLTGIASFITHSGSPPAQAYLMPQQLGRLTFAGTIAIAFAIGNLAKLPGYWALGQLDALDLRLTALLVVSGIAGTFAGRVVTGRLSDDQYRRVIELLLLVLSLLLLGKAGWSLIRPGG